MTVIAFHREYVDLTGSITAALMLSQAVYWMARTKDDDGWVYKSQADWETETGLTRTEYETARKRLNRLPFWQEDHHGPRGTLRFRVDLRQLQTTENLQTESNQTAENLQTESNQIAENLQTRMQESCKLIESDCGNPATQNAGILQTPYTETTTETTSTEITTESERAREVVTVPASVAPTPTKPIIRVSSPYLKSARFENGFIPAGAGQNAVQVYYERMDIRLDKARLNAIQEDDLVRLCPDLDVLRDVVTAYSRTNYRPGNVQLILDWYRRGIPEHQQAPAANGNGKRLTKVERSMAAVDEVWAMMQAQEDQSWITPA